ncbi:uncharacterized protein LOC129031620 [Pongo pygmaeus]|uniref:uncharacterized protein LOC129031620 n=1 Tax=Pongo pygmaeus TaxID=9600 RepID=UPI0023E174FF|nr:uncharacterized protein LOC129031620 [Pongo pygmaeus]
METAGQGLPGRAGPGRGLGLRVLGRSRRPRRPPAPLVPPRSLGPGSGPGTGAALPSRKRCRLARGSADALPCPRAGRAACGRRKPHCGLSAPRSQSGFLSQREAFVRLTPSDCPVLCPSLICSPSPNLGSCSGNKEQDPECLVQVQCGPACGPGVSRSHGPREEQKPGGEKEPPWEVEDTSDGVRVLAAELLPLLLLPVEWDLSPSSCLWAFAFSLYNVFLSHPS